MQILLVLKNVSCTTQSILNLQGEKKIQTHHAVEMLFFSVDKEAGLRLC